MILERAIGLGDAPIAYGSERPRYSALARAIEGMLADLRRPLADLSDAVFTLTGLPEAQIEKAEGEPFRYPKKVRRAINRAIDTFLEALAGPDRSREGFVNGGLESETPDGVLQQRAVLGYAVGLQRAGDLLDRPLTLTAARSDPAVKEMLDNAFTRLSQGGLLRLEGVRDEIHGILVGATEAGLGPLDTARQLSRQFDQYNRYEFERLARTESAFAAIAGNRDQMEEFGVAYVIWLFDVGACPICRAYDGKLIPITDTANLPPAHPNCLCDVSPAG